MQTLLFTRAKRVLLVLALTCMALFPVKTFGIVSERRAAVGSHFWILYAGETPPGRRDWYQVSNDRWVEVVYANDSSMVYEIIARRVALHGVVGTHVRRYPHNQLDFFIPDPTSEVRSRQVYFRVGPGTWQRVGEALWVVHIPGPPVP